MPSPSQTSPMAAPTPTPESPATLPGQFTGYAAPSAEKWSDLKLHKFTPKPFGDYDIDIKIHYCGVCGSDIHVLRSGWSPTIYPCVPGHEVTGIIIRTGSLVTSPSLYPGAIVGIGAHAWSCGACDACAGEDIGTKPGAGRDWGPSGEHGHGGEGGLRGGKENYCKEVVETYNWRYKDGSLAWGCYANYARIHENFVYLIPPGIPQEIVAPMFCGGVTMYSPLKRANIGAGSQVGIAGIGGLGHFGILFARALGATVTAISHSSRKAEDAVAMGASQFLVSSDPGWNLPYLRTLDLVISTNPSTDMPLASYLSLLKVGGTLVICGIPEGDLPKLSWADLATANLAIRGSNVGSKKEVLEMLELVKEKEIKSWVEVVEMKEAGKVLERLNRGEGRYRFVLKADFEEGV